MRMVTNRTSIIPFEEGAYIGRHPVDATLDEMCRVFPEFRDRKQIQTLWRNGEIRRPARPEGADKLAWECLIVAPLRNELGRKKIKADGSISFILNDYKELIAVTTG
jgi:hypothetical protein